MAGARCDWSLRRLLMFTTRHPLLGIRVIERQRGSWGLAGTITPIWYRRPETRRLMTTRR